MWLPQGGALKIENLQFTQYSIIMLLFLIGEIELSILTHLLLDQVHVHVAEDVDQ